MPDREEIFDLYEENNGIDQLFIVKEEDDEDEEPGEYDLEISTECYWHAVDPENPNYICGECGESECVEICEYVDENGEYVETEKNDTGSYRCTNCGEEWFR